MASRLLLAHDGRQLIQRAQQVSRISPNHKLVVHHFARTLHTRPPTSLLLTAASRPRVVSTASRMIVLQTRPFSIGRLFVTAARVPVMLVGAAAGGVAYVNHKIEGK